MVDLEPLSESSLPTVLVSSTGFDYLTLSSPSVFSKILIPDPLSTSDSSLNDNYTDPPTITSWHQQNIENPTSRFCEDFYPDAHFDFLSKSPQSEISNFYNPTAAKSPVDLEKFPVFENLPPPNQPPNQPMNQPMNQPQNVITHVPLFGATHSVDENVFLDSQADRDKRFIRIYGNHRDDPANSLLPTSVMSDMPVRDSCIPPAQDGKLVEYPLPLPLPPLVSRIPILLYQNLYPDAGLNEPLLC